jgi:hypothetical protein
MVKPIEKMELGIPRLRWEFNFKMNARKKNVMRLGGGGILSSAEIEY